jgi:hypothetical protein
MQMPFRPRVEGLEERCLPSTVTNLSDHDPGSLRDAIASTPSGGTVDFQAGLSGTIILTTSELGIAKDLTITGPGADVITVSGNRAFRVFNIAPTFVVAISGLTIADGFPQTDGGGGILSAGTVTITASILSGNRTAPFGRSGGAISNSSTMTITRTTLNGNSVGNLSSGGAISNSGTMTITSSILSDNSVGALSSGGAIVNSGTLTVTDSTFSGNFSGSEGGGVASQGTVTVTNSTFRGNFARFGGGISYSGDDVLTITSTTISGNEAIRFGGGIFRDSGTVMIKNTIVAANVSGFGGPDVSGTLNSQGHNLIGNGTGGSGFADSDMVGTSADPIDPQLEPLGDYGGPTPTMRPLPTSSAVDAGDNTDAPKTDQRGFDRIVNGIIDIGAVELQPDEFGPRSPDSLLIPFVKPMAGSWGSVVEAPVSPVARHEVTEPLQYVDTTVRHAKDLVFGESHRAQRLVPASEWESNELVV